MKFTHILYPFKHPCRFSLALRALTNILHFSYIDYQIKACHHFAVFADFCLLMYVYIQWRSITFTVPILQSVQVYSTCCNTDYVPLPPSSPSASAPPPPLASHMPSSFPLLLPDVNIRKFSLITLVNVETWTCDTSRNSWNVGWRKRYFFDIL